LASTITDDELFGGTKSEIQAEGAVSDEELLAPKEIGVAPQVPDLDKPLASQTFESRAFEAARKFEVKRWTPEELGAVNKNLFPFLGTNIFFDPKEDSKLNPITRPFRKLNNLLFQEGSTLIEGGFKGIIASIEIGAGSIADAYELATGDKASADRLERDLMAIPESTIGKITSAAKVATGASVVGTAAGRILKAEQQAKDIMIRALNQVPEADRPRVKRLIEARMKEIGGVTDEAAKTKQAVAEYMAAERVMKGPTEIPLNVSKFQDDILTAVGAQKISSKRSSEQVYEALGGLRVDKEVLRNLLKKHGIKRDDIGEIIGKPSLTARKSQDYADFLHQLADLRLEAELGSKGAARAIDAYVNREWQGDRIHQFMESFHKWENIRRGMMVSSVATAARNATVATGRIGLDILEDAFDIAIAKAGQKAGFVRMDAGDIKPFDAFGASLEWLVRGNAGAGKDVVADIMKRFPHQYERFVGRVIAQIEDVNVPSGTTGLGGTLLGQGLRKAAGSEPSDMERAVFVANTFNRFQEMVFRRAKFGAILDTELKKAGTSLDDVVKSNMIGAIDENMIAKAVTEALDFTFAGDPKSKFVRDTVHRLTRIPGFTLEIPFPRFVSQSTRFMWEHSPGAALKLLSREERAKIAAGDVSTLSKMASGGVLSLSTWEMINSGAVEMGDNWHEIVVGGKKVDIAPYQPFAAWVFIADLTKRYKEDRIIPHNITLTTVAEGMLSTAAQIGTGYEIADGLLRTVLGISKENKESRGEERLGASIGGYVSSFLTSINQLSDFYAQFDKMERVTRDTKVGIISEESKPDSPLFRTLANIGEAAAGRVAGRLPGVKQMLPEKEFATRAGSKVSTEVPILRAALGVKILGKSNPLERELGRLGFDFRNTEPFTGIPQIDRAIAAEMGNISERLLIPLVEGRGYKSLSDTKKSYILSEQLKNVRSAAMDRASAKYPNLFMANRILEMPALKLRMLERAQEAKGVQPEDTLVGKMKSLFLRGREQVKESAYQQ